VSNDTVSMKEEGLLYKSIKTRTLSKIYTSNNNIYSFVNQDIIKYNSQGEIIYNTFLFDISTNNGKSWFFLTEKKIKI